MVAGFGLPDTMCDKANDILFYRKGKNCTLNGADLNCNLNDVEFKIAGNNIKYSNDGKVATTNFGTKSGTKFVCSESFKEYGSCDGTINATCKNNWAKCDNLDKTNQVYACDSNTYNYDPTTNKCKIDGGGNGTYSTSDICYHKAVKKFIHCDCAIPY